MSAYAGQALTKGWMNYEIVQLTMPDEETRKDANFSGVSYWVVDYPLAAQKVQTAIYGTSNIQLDADRESALDYVRYNNSSGSSSSGGNNSSGNSSYNDNDDNVNDSSSYTENEYTTDEYRTGYDDVTGGETEETTTRIGVHIPSLDDLFTTAPDDDATTAGDKKPTEKTTASNQDDNSDDEPEEEPATTARQFGWNSFTEAA